MYFQSCESFYLFVYIFAQEDEKYLRIRNLEFSLNNSVAFHVFYGTKRGILYLISLYMYHFIILYRIEVFFFLFVSNLNLCSFYIKLLTSFVQYIMPVTIYDISPLNFVHPLHVGYEIFILQFFACLFCYILKYFITWEFKEKSNCLPSYKYVPYQIIVWSMVQVRISYFLLIT